MCSGLSYIPITLAKSLSVASFLISSRNTVFVLKMMLSTMTLDSLFLSLLISRPAAEKIRSDDIDVEEKARTCLAIIEILYY